MKQNEVINVVPFTSDEPLCYVDAESGRRFRFRPMAIITYSIVTVDAVAGELDFALEPPYEPIRQSWYLAPDGDQFPMERVFTMDEAEDLTAPETAQ